MSNKLYVGGLSFQTSQEDLHRLFGEVGKVLTASLITDRDSGRSRGFAFVEMDSPSLAETAISRLNGQQFDGRTLVVSEAREREARR